MRIIKQHLIKQRLHKILLFILPKSGVSTLSGQVLANESQKAKKDLAKSLRLNDYGPMAINIIFLNMTQVGWFVLGWGV